MIATWSIPIGILILIIAIFFAIYYYIKFKKIFLVLIIFSISSFIYGIFYVWDVFSLKRNLVIILLLGSATSLFGIGQYLSSIELSYKNKKHEIFRMKNKIKIIYISLFIIGIVLFSFLIFFGTNQNKISYNYNFLNQINLTSNINGIGNLTIINQGVFPKNFKTKILFGCGNSARFYTILARNSFDNFLLSYNQKIININSYSNKTYKLFLEKNFNLNQKNLLNKSLNISIYEIDSNNNNLYNSNSYCLVQNKRFLKKILIR